MHVVNYTCDVCNKPCTEDSVIADGYGAILVELVFPHMQTSRDAEVCSKICLHKWIDKELKV